VAVLGNRGTGVLDMLIQGLRQDGQNIAQPNMSPVPPTPLQRTMNQPQTTLGSYGKMTTSQPQVGSPIYEANMTPLMRDMTQGRVMYPNETVQMPEPMPVPQVIEREQARRGMATPDTMGMEKLAADASEIKGAIDENPQLESDPSFMDQVKGYFGSRENMLRLAMAFNTMRLEPDQGLARALGDELKDVRSTQLARSERNRTAAYFDSIDPKISAAIRNGLSAKDAIALFREQQKGVVVGKMIVNPTTGAVIYDGSQEGSELPATYRALQLRAEAAGLVPGTEAYSQFMINGGQRAGLSVKTNPDGTFEITEGGATGSGRAMTEGQAKALTFSQRMEASQRILGTVEQEGTSIFNSIVSNVPFAGNLLTSPEYKLYDQAKRDFVNAVLRFESGAAIAASEFANADVQYFPQPGDTEAVIRQKRNNRDLAIAVMKRSAGPDQEAYAKKIRVDIFGPRAENWPEVGTIEDHPYKQGVKVRYIGGDPELPENFEEVK